MTQSADHFDTVVIGGGQSGLSAGYYLKKAGVPFQILEAQPSAVGSWPQYYESLKLFSPRRYSSLPGLAFPGEPDGFPARDEVVDYLKEYQTLHQLPVRTDSLVSHVSRTEVGFRVALPDDHTMTCDSIIVASGPHNRPLVPPCPHLDQFRGQILHSFDYVKPSDLGIDGEGSRLQVIVVGSKNSAIQIAYELADVCDVTIASRRKVRFVNQTTCGMNIYWWERVLGIARIPFGLSTALSRQMMRLGGVIDDGTYRKAMAEGVIVRRQMFEQFYDAGVVWPNGERQKADIVIFATGYKSNVDYLSGLPGALDDDEQPRHRMGISPVDGLYYLGLVGMRNIASATLRGVAVDAKAIVQRLVNQREARQSADRRIGSLKKSSR